MFFIDGCEVAGVSTNLAYLKRAIVAAGGGLD
jgi:hypothetical protein